MPHPKDAIASVAFFDVNVKLHISIKVSHGKDSLAPIEIIVHKEFSDQGFIRVWPTTALPSLAF